MSEDTESPKPLDEGGVASVAPCSPVISASWHAEYLKAADRAIRMEMQRDEARREAERWRDCFKTGMSLQPKSPSQIFPWENAKILPTREGEGSIKIKDDE
jgi:hypothetical protein